MTFVAISKYTVDSVRFAEIESNVLMPLISVAEIFPIRTDWVIESPTCTRKYASQSGLVVQMIQHRTPDKAADATCRCVAVIRWISSPSIASVW